MAEGRILLTGGTGFVGRHIAEHMRANGRALTLAVRRGRGLVSAPGIRVLEVGSIGPRTDWSAALEGVSAVVHLAAHVHVAPEKARGEAGLFDEVNHLGSVRLFDAAAQAGVGAFVFMSSITVLGDEASADAPYDDNSVARPITPYAVSKLAAEVGLARRGHGSGTRLVILRPPLVCGPGVAGNLGSLARIAACPIPLPLGGIDNRRTLLSIGNLCSMVEAAATRPVQGTYAVGDLRPLSTTEIVGHLRAGAGRRSWLVPAPTRLTRAIAALAGRAGQAQRLLGDLVVDSGRFRRSFGWTDAVDTASTLRATGAAAAARSPVASTPMLVSADGDSRAGERT